MPYCPPTWQCSVHSRKHCPHLLTALLKDDHVISIQQDQAGHTTIWPSTTVKMAINIVGQSEAELASFGLNVSAYAVQKHIETKGAFTSPCLKPMETWTQLPCLLASSVRGRTQTFCQPSGRTSFCHVLPEPAQIVAEPASASFCHVLPEPAYTGDWGSSVLCLLLDPTINLLDPPCRLALTACRHAGGLP